MRKHKTFEPVNSYPLKPILSRRFMRRTVQRRDSTPGLFVRLWRWLFGAPPPPPEIVDDDQDYPPPFVRIPRMK